MSAFYTEDMVANKVVRIVRMNHGSVRRTYTGLSCRFTITRVLLNLIELDGYLTGRCAINEEVLRRLFNVVPM